MAAMRILVFSDTHGHADRLRKVVREQLRAGSIDKIFFLGDGIRDIMSLSNEYPSLDIRYVYGNCDDAFTTDEERANAVYEEKITAGGITFLLMHGHRYDVKYGLDNAMFRGLETGADIVLYGHTHVAEDTVLTSDFGERMRFINPGSLAGFKPSYALLNIVGREVICGFGEL